jgi:HD-like signal output (HDOD) protein
MTPRMSATKLEDWPRSLDAVAKEIGEISTLPQIALSVMEVAADQDAGADDLRQVLEGDAALAARVLRSVNSASYGLQNEVTNLLQAISHLGFNQIRNLAMTAAVSELFKVDEVIGSYRRSELWRHLVSVGVCARLLAMRRKMPNFEDAFLAGLLHDFGIILEDQWIHEPFRTVVTRLPEFETLVDCERECLGFDHTQLASRIAKDWKFPDAVKASILHHHASREYSGAGADVVQVVEVANVLCTIKGISSVGRKAVRPNLELFAEMGLHKRDIIVLAEDLDRELTLNEGLFAL